MTGLTPEQMALQLTERGETWADTDAAASALEETRRSLRAQIATERLETGDSAAKAELYAEADERYRSHLKAMVEARRTATRARVRYETMRAYVDMWRSQESTRRAEMKIL